VREGGGGEAVGLGVALFRKALSVQIIRIKCGHDKIIKKLRPLIAGFRSRNLVQRIRGSTPGRIRAVVL
jgi:hypothetical protein